jgi:hypothetical protein
MGPPGRVSTQARICALWRTLMCRKPVQSTDIVYCAIAPSTQARKTAAATLLSATCGRAVLFQSPAMISWREAAAETSARRVHRGRVDGRHRQRVLSLT